MLKVKTVVSTTIAILVFSAVLPVFASSYLGGDWTYGGYHEIFNWGAFSNYYHRDSYHWSYVGSRDRDNEDKDYASAGRMSHAFINTSIGEPVEFDAGK